MNGFIGKFIVPVFLVIALPLAGCSLTGSPTPPPQPNSPSVVPSLSAANGDECLLGEWELNDFADSINSMLPNDLEFQYSGTSGRIHWTFDISGVAQVQAANFTLNFASKSDPSLILSVITNGLALRDYKVTAPGEITFSIPDDSALTYTAQMNGVTVNLDQLFQGLSPVPGVGTIAYHCQGRSLSVIPPKPGALPEGFSKVGP